MDSRKLPNQDAYRFRFEGVEAETVAAAFTEHINNCLAEDQEDDPNECYISIANWDLENEAEEYVVYVEDPADFINILNRFGENTQEEAKKIAKESDKPRFSDTIPAERLRLGSFVVDIVEQISEKVTQSEIRREFTGSFRIEALQSIETNGLHKQNKSPFKSKPAKKS